MGCKWFIHPFERVHRTAERVVKFVKQLTRTGEWLTYPFEWVVKFFKWLSRTTEQVVKFFKWLSRTTERVKFFKWLTRTGERLIKISERVHQMTALYIRSSILFWNETSIWIVSTITTVCEHASLFWDCNFSKNYIGRTSLLR